VLAHEGEHHSPGGNGQPGDAPLVAMAFTPCVGGMAGTFPCNKVDLASFLPVADIDGTTAAGITTPTTSGVGLTRRPTRSMRSRSLERRRLRGRDEPDERPSTSATSPATPSDSLWRSMKVYRNHLYVVSEAASHGMQVFDLTQLRNVPRRPSPSARPRTTTTSASAHTINVNEETGYLYVAGSKPNPNRTPNVDTCPGATATRGGGLHMIDVHNPAAPAFAGCVNNDGYTHETQCVIYRGPDAQHRGREVCFSSNEDTLTIVDVTNKSAPLQLSRTPYAGSGYTHQGWLTGDQRASSSTTSLTSSSNNSRGTIGLRLGRVRPRRALRAYMFQGSTPRSTTTSTCAASTPSSRTTAAASAS
jgi:hypothetical protein